MFDYITFLFYLYFILISIFGYGNFFSKTIYPSYNLLNFSVICFNGLIFVAIISFTTSFFFKHNFFHNIILHSIGIFFFFKLKFYKLYKKKIKNIFFLSLFYLLGLLIFKTHDDFPYYHLTYTRFLYDNEIFLGMGWLGHGFRTFSSIFFINSVNILPGLKFYGYHFSIFYLLIFTSFFFIEKIKIYLKNNNSLFLLFFAILAFIYCNNKFHRLGEYGVDRSAQIILFIIIFLFFETQIFIKQKKSELINNNLLFLIILVSFTATLKSLFLIYILFVLYFYKKILNLNFIKKYFKALSFSFYLFFLIFTTNFLNTGCFIYPAQSTCIESFSWSIPKSTVKKMKVHYEWWSKAGGGPDYKHNLEKEEYIKNFNWFENWIDRHFFNKVSDNIIFTLFICALLLFFIRKSKFKKKNFEILKFKYFYSIFFIIFLEWFFNHPSMRYGGYIIFSLPIILLFSKFISKIKYDFLKLKKNFCLLIVLSLIVFNIENILRIKKEVIKYNYNYMASPYYFLPNLKYEKKLINSVYFYKPVNNSCWHTPTPCAQSYKFNIIEKYNKKIIISKKDD